MKNRFRNLPVQLPDDGKGDEHELIETLRKEAQEVKDCFTRFSFAALGIATGVFGLIASQMEQRPWVGISAIPVIVMLVVVARIGTHKYATSNRNFGYELNLGRARASGAPQDVVYEEAMLAWRIVQATILNSLQDRKAWCVMPQRHISSLRRGSGSSRQSPTYAAGSYLRNMLVMLLVISVLATIPIILLLFLKQDRPHPMIVGVILLVADGIFLWSLWRPIFQNCTVLEGGVKSIQGSAVMWDFVVQAHRDAAVRTKSSKCGSTDYMKDLATQAVAICSSIKMCPQRIAELTPDRCNQCRESARCKAVP